MLGLRPSRYERKAIENRLFRSNAVSLIQNFRYKGSTPTNHFCTDSLTNECLTTLTLTVFTQRNLVADFFQAKCDFRQKSAVLRFWAPFGGRGGGLGATYDDHLRLTGKRVVEFILVLVKLFFARCYVWGATSEYHFKIGDFAPTAASWKKISGRKGRPHQPFFFSEN